ncbi:hypothetical protein ETC03_16650 [Geobacillus sp. MMMUD3]|nr:hypothetical protein [Geobacillus sp. MMMUD3]
MLHSYRLLSLSNPRQWNHSITNKPRFMQKVKGAAAFCNETKAKNNCFFRVTSCYKIGQDGAPDTKNT